MNITLLGAAPDTGNLGVSALCYSTIYSLNQQKENINWNIINYGKGIRKENITIGESEHKLTLAGAYWTKKIFNKESLHNILLSNHFNGLINPISKLFLSSNVFLDVSGGDSFSDIYGESRFNKVFFPKQVVKNSKKPLILLPQTYGPFINSKCEKKAADLVKYADYCWSRDLKSHEVLKGLLGNDFDSKRHQSGTDLAFLLPKTPCDDSTPDKIKQCLNSSSETIVGINISGLLYQNEKEAQDNFSIKFSYRELINKVISYFKSQGITIVLVPHVFNKNPNFDNDLEACKSVHKNIDESYQSKVHIVDFTRDPCQIKWFISKLDFLWGQECIQQLLH